MCRILTNLGTLNLANSNLKPQCVPYLTEMADEHPTLHSVDLSGNPGVGFAAAQLLLPLIKDGQGGRVRWMRIWAKSHPVVASFFQNCTLRVPTQEGKVALDNQGGGILGWGVTVGGGSNSNV